MNEFYSKLIMYHQIHKMSRDGWSKTRIAEFLTSFKLLKSRFITLMVLAIFIVVGVDVGFNSNSGQFLMNTYGMGQVEA